VSEGAVSVGSVRKEGAVMYGGLMFVRWALQEKEREPRPESEEWWRRRALTRTRAVPDPVRRPEPIAVQELRDRLEAIGLG
jgi:hypothetical protein